LKKKERKENLLEGRLLIVLKLRKAVTRKMGEKGDCRGCEN